MIPEERNMTVFSSQKEFQISSYNEANNTCNDIINRKLSPLPICTNNNIIKCNESSQRTFTTKNSDFHKRFDSPLIINSQNLKQSEKIKREKNKIQKEKNKPQTNLPRTKLLDKYKIYIQKLQKYLKMKDEEINSLKKEFQDKLKSINKNGFENLDTGGMGIIILAGKKQNQNNEFISPKRIYKMQFLDKMEILNTKNSDINIESRDSIEILPTIKKLLKAQKVIEMSIKPLKQLNYIQILDQMSILNEKNKLNYIKIEGRDSIEILPTAKTPLKAQKVNQMFVEKMEIPEFFIQNLDNMIVIKSDKKNNMIESRDSIKIFSEERIPLKAQHIGNMIIDSLDKNIIKLSEKKDILKTPRNKSLQKIRNSIEHVPLKKSPLQMKNAEDLKNKYLKKYKSEQKEINKFNTREKKESKNEYIGAITDCSNNYLPKSRYKYYNYEDVSIKPTLKMQNTNNYTRIKSIPNNHKLEEISYKNKNFKYNLAIPKPSILPLSRTSKNINISKYENRRENKSNNNSNNNSNKNYSNIIKGGYKSKNSRNDHDKSNTNYSECKNKKGRNVKVIRTQKNGPSIIEKRFIAHSCEKCNNYLNFKKDSIRNNFHEIHSIKQK